MSVFTPVSIQAIAQSINVKLADEAAKALAPDVEYRLREIIQDSLKFARHSCRTKLTTNDVISALRLRNVEAVFGGMGQRDPARFVKATGHPDVYFVEDRTLTIKEAVYFPLPKAPAEPTILPHWLFIEGCSHAPRRMQ
ncbi:MAG: hypothetical protein WDW38_002384 [Sanguina aurantia]